MAMPFFLPNDDDTEENYRRLERLIRDLYHVLRLLLTRGFAPPDDEHISQGPPPPPPSAHMTSINHPRSAFVVVPPSGQSSRQIARPVAPFRPHYAPPMSPAAAAGRAAIARMSLPDLVPQQGPSSSSHHFSQQASCSQMLKTPSPRERRVEDVTEPLNFSAAINPRTFAAKVVSAVTTSFMSGTTPSYFTSRPGTTYGAGTSASYYGGRPYMSAGTGTNAADDLRHAQARNNNVVPGVSDASTSTTVADWVKVGQELRRIADDLHLTLENQDDNSSDGSQDDAGARSLQRR